MDVVFHLAGNLNLWPRRDAEQTRDNVDGTRNTVTAALEKKARRFVHTSSIQAYGMAKGPITEEAERELGYAAAPPRIMVEENRNRLEAEGLLSPEPRG
ncbi:MAG: NAD-dependent epimerase/dehydratase family protein [Alphaproteobacteria bacterium]